MAETHVKRHRLMLVGTVAPEVVDAVEEEVDRTGLSRSIVMERRLRSAYGLPQPVRQSRRPKLDGEA